jgi:hypothetical protein
MRPLLLIVEGQGDEKAAPILVRKILEQHDRYDIMLRPTQRRGEYPAVAKSFDNFFLAAIKERAPILWIMDFDTKGYDCPYREAASLAGRAAQLYPKWPIAFAFLVKEFETLFLHDETATRTVFTDIPKQVVFPAQPEHIRGAKEWLSEKRPKGAAYKESVHQQKIAANLDIELLRQKSADFAHLERALLKLIDAEIPA